MSPPIPTEVPSVITAGTTVQFTRSFQDFPPADGWIYKFDLNAPSGVVHNTAEEGSDPFKLTLAPTDTASLVTDPDGEVCYYQESVTLPGSGGDPDVVQVVGTGPITILLNLATAPPGAMTSHAQKMVTLIEAEIERRMTEGGGVQSYSIGTGAAARALVKVPIEKLQEMLGKYKAQLNAQANPSGLGNAIKVAFPEIVPTSDYPPTWIDVVGLPDNK